MSGHEYLRKHALECLRMEADCKELAERVRSPHVRSHFLKMAGIWSALAMSAPSEHVEAKTTALRKPAT